jgi:hypothetical protein
VENCNLRRSHRHDDWQAVVFRWRTHALPVAERG